MPLRLRAEPETVQEFELSAEEKYIAGLELMTRGHFGTGIYIMGYAAEMLLKNVYFLLDQNTRPTFPVGSALRQAQREAAQVIRWYRFQDYHDLRFWAFLIAAKRHQEGRELPALVGLPFMNCVTRLYDNWWVALRYQQDRASTSEANEVYEDVTWIRDHYAALYTPRR